MKELAVAKRMTDDSFKIFTSIILVPGIRIPNINQFPILNKNEASKELEIPFQKDCGKDDECQSQLSAQLQLFNDDMTPLSGNILGKL